MSGDDYTRAMRYELLVRNAFDCARGNRNGADLSFMKNAITMERGESFAKHLGSFDKQFTQVKNYLSKALIKLSKTKPYSVKRDFFLTLNSELVGSTSTVQLIHIVDLASDEVTNLRKS